MKEIIISYLSRRAEELLREKDAKGYAYLKAIETINGFKSISKLDILKGKITGKYIGPSIAAQIKELATKDLEKLKSKPISLNPHKHYTLRSEVLNKIKFLLNILDSKKVNYTICGSYRRECNYVGDIDILVFEEFPDLSSLECKVVAKGDKLMKLKFDELEVDMRSVKEENRGPALVFYTGPKNFNIWLRSEAKKQGYKLNEYSLSNNMSEFNFTSEEDLFKFLGVSYIKPSERELWR